MSTLAVLSATLCIVLPDTLSAQSPPYAVGFRVIEARDSSRAFAPAVDWRGREARDPSRPLQVSIWYPAVPDARGPAMRASDYLALTVREVTDLPIDTARERARRVHDRRAELLGATADQRDRLWSDTLRARRDVPVARGRFPLVLYATSANASNPVLVEELAAQGYVVASIPSNGRMTDNAIAFAPNPLTLDTDVADVGFLLSVMRRLPFVDASRVGVVTFSAASLPILLWQMRDMQADALVLVEGWERYRIGAELLATSPHYDPQRVRVPILLLERAADEAAPAYAKVVTVVDSLRQATIRRVAFRDARHVDFLSHAFGASEHQPTIRATSAAMIQRFLDAALKGTSGSDVTSTAAITVTTRAADPPRPTEEELFRLAEIDAREAERVYRETRGSGPPLFRREVLTRAASFAIEPIDRVIILGIVADAYPHSTDARFRLADALLAVGERDRGLTVLRAARDVVPRDPSLEAGARTEWLRRIDARLDRER